MTADRRVLIWQVLFGLAMLAAWEAVGHVADPTWTSRPSLIAARLVAWSGNGLATQVGVTAAEIVIGLAIGLPLGVLAGFALGASRILAGIMRPVVMALYTIPFVALAPFLIFVLGLGMAPKIFLVAVVGFFLLLFTTFAGMLEMDRDLLRGLALMGASRFEIFRKLLLPACMVWILGGLKTALPFALIAATAGEMLAPGAGIGAVLTTATQQFDMTSYYAGLFIVMLMGLLVGGAAISLERYMLRWRGRDV